MTVINSCDIDAYAAWQQRRVGPAYMRGMPTWVWQSALRGSRNRRRRESLVT